MSYTLHAIEQRTPEWHALRAGRIGSSEAADLLATRKGKGEPACRRDLRTAKALERLTGTSLDGAGFVGADMQRGIDREPDARLAYEIATGRAVRAIGYVARTDLPIGWSPDGVVGQTIAHAIELKCPRPANQLAIWRDCGAATELDAVPSTYQAGVAHAFVTCDGLERIDFVSYAPEFSGAREDLVLYIAPVTREQAAKAIAAYRLALARFLAELDAEIEAIRSMPARVVA